MQNQTRSTEYRGRTRLFSGARVPEAKFAWLHRLTVAWREWMARPGRPEQPAMAAAVQALEQAVASRNLDTISERLRAVYEQWRQDSTARAIGMIVQATGPFYWDKQLESDVAAGKLDACAREALREHKAGRTTSLCPIGQALGSGAAITPFPEKLRSSRIAVSHC
jgi:hypothetical protein